MHCHNIASVVSQHTQYVLRWADNGMVRMLPVDTHLLCLDVPMEVYVNESRMLCLNSIHVCLSDGTSVSDRMPLLEFCKLVIDCERNNVFGYMMQVLEKHDEQRPRKRHQKIS
jgi:hypothetical protein